MTLINFRPISILPALSKIYERAMYDQLYAFLILQDILFEYQFGFRKSLSPKLAILNLINYVLQELCQGKYVITVFIDLKKAFDTLNHDILIKKLKHYAISNKCLDWFKSYLYDRKQLTSVNNVYSGHAKLKTGVPQGLTLGPVFFLIYINDIIKSSTILKYMIFAGDTNVSTSSSDLQQLNNTINSELDLISEWLLSNKLSLNMNKSNYLIYAGNKRINIDVDLRLSGENIESEIWVNL